jgi:hypothetical protein
VKGRCSIAEVVHRQVTPWLGLGEGQLLHGWGWAKASYSTAEVRRKPVTPLLGFGEREFLQGWGWAKASYSIAEVRWKPVTLCLCLAKTSSSRAGLGRRAVTPQLKFGEGQLLQCWCWAKAVE